MRNRTRTRPGSDSALRLPQPAPQELSMVRLLALAAALGLTPVVFAIHGGGWVNGSKDGYRGAAKRFNDAGISLVAINYRMVTEAAEKKIDPPVKWPLEDAARALQFVRSKAAEWNLVMTRIGAT